MRTMNNEELPDTKEINTLFNDIKKAVNRKFYGEVLKIFISLSFIAGSIIGMGAPSLRIAYDIILGSATFVSMCLHIPQRFRFVPLTEEKKQPIDDKMSLIYDNLKNSIQKQTPLDEPRTVA